MRIGASIMRLSWVSPRGLSVYWRSWKQRGVLARALRSATRAIVIAKVRMRASRFSSARRKARRCFKHAAQARPYAAGTAPERKERSGQLRLKRGAHAGAAIAP